MKPIVPPTLENYSVRHSSPESALFKALARVTYAKTDWPQMQVGHLEGLFLKMIVRILKPKRILEIGTFTGYSALAMAEGLPKGGRLDTCDINPKTTGIARAFWKKSPHGKKIRLHLGPAVKTIQKLKGPFDLVFIDADKPNYRNYWKLCVPKMRRGGILLVDNVLWSGRVLNPKDKTDRAITAFNRLVKKDKRVEAVMLTVRDGITLAYRK